MPWVRGAITTGSAVGSDAGMNRTSEVCLDSIAISTKRRERVSPTDTKNRSSGS